MTGSPELQSETGARPAGTETSGRGEAGGSVVTTDSWQALQRTQRRLMAEWKPISAGVVLLSLQWKREEAG